MEDHVNHKAYCKYCEEVVSYSENDIQRFLDYFQAPDASITHAIEEFVICPNCRATIYLRCPTELIFKKTLVSRERL